MMHETPCSTLLVNQTKVENFESWQRRQNGDMNEIRQEVQATKGLIDQRISRLDDRMTSLERWIMGTLAAALLGVGIAVLNMLAR